MICKTIKFHQKFASIFTNQWVEMKQALATNQITVRLEVKPMK